MRKPLRPGEEVKLNFDLEAKAEGFSDNNPKNELAYNGSRINLNTWGSNEYFPSLGFNEDAIISDRERRKEYGLAAIVNLPKPEDYNESHQNNSESFITFNGVFSTSAPQMIISNGDLISEWASKTGRVVTVEDNALKGGFGSGVLELLARRGLNNVEVVNLGMPDHFIEHGPQEILYKNTRIDIPAITQAVLDLIAKHK